MKFELFMRNMARKMGSVTGYGAGIAGCWWFYHWIGLLPMVGGICK